MTIRPAIAILLIALQSAALAESSQADKEAYFERHVRPALVEHCLECHDEDNAESELRMDSLAGLLRGGIRGPAIVRGKPEESLLIRAVRHGEILQMPPKRKLPRETIARLAKWIEQGAAWPNARTESQPDAANEPGKGIVNQKAREFWAFRPPQRPALPKVRNASWVRTPIDAFILAKLEQEGAAPSPEATREVLLRRIAFNLTGLPPTREVRERFLSDKSPAAIDRLVDALLASPRYGERWGRHWLDVARYADSNGLDENLAYGNAFRYRDYVVDAWNQNLPFDVFVQEQLAGDLLPLDKNGDWRRRIPATGFLSIGPKMLAEDDPLKLQMDIVDEQIDTVGRAFMGMTLGCARCHDHKFDPIPTSDYYALAGIFKSTKTMDTFTVVARWHERPIATPEQLAEREKGSARAARFAAQREQLEAYETKRLTDAALASTADYLLTAETARRHSEAMQLVGDKQVDGRIRFEAENFVRGNVVKDASGYGKGIGVILNHPAETPRFTEYDVEVKTAGLYQIEARYAAAASRPTRLFINGQLVAKDLADGVTGSWYPDTQRWEVEGLFALKAGKNVLRLEISGVLPHIDKLQLVPSFGAGIPPALAPPNPQLLAEVTKAWRTFLDQDKSAWSARWRRAREAADEQGRLPDKTFAGELSPTPGTLQELALRWEQAAQGDRDEAEALRAVLVGKEGPLGAKLDWKPHYRATIRQQIARIDGKHKEALAAVPKFAEAMSVEDGKVEDVRIHVRGSHLTQTRVAPRRLPQALCEPSAQPAFSDKHSGRLQLAQWLTHADHPLTARVFVNRLWRWHFGAGLVRSPDNFGRLGERPTHPELLDWLAVELVESGWDVKRMHRLILSSAVWRQSSQGTAELARRDPANHLWSRANRRRLEAESIRDSILAVAGQLDLQIGGAMLPIANRAYVTSTANVNPAVYDSQRRSLYLPVVRSALYEVFQAFDFADPSALLGDRQSTTVAPQALFMMNSELVAENARRMAANLLQEETGDQRERIKQLHEAVFSRTASADEIREAEIFLTNYAKVWKEAQKAGQVPADLEPQLAAWRGLCRSLLGANEFIYLD